MNMDEEKPSAEEDSTGAKRFFKKFKNPYGKQLEVTETRIEYTPSTDLIDLTINMNHSEDESSDVSANGSDDNNNNRIVITPKGPRRRIIRRKSLREKNQYRRLVSFDSDDERTNGAVEVEDFEENEISRSCTPNKDASNELENADVSSENESNTEDADLIQNTPLAPVPRTPPLRTRLSLTHTYEKRVEAHVRAELDKNNILYRFENSNCDVDSDTTLSSDDEDNEDDDDDIDEKYKKKTFFCQNKFETVEILKSFVSKMDSRRKLEYYPEDIKRNSSFTRLLSQKKTPLIIYYNQLYRPKSETADGLIVACCTFVYADKKCCPGAVHCSRSTGLIAEHTDCTHPFRRAFIGCELLTRRLIIMELNGDSRQDQTGVAMELCDFYRIQEEVHSNEWLVRKVNNATNVANSSKTFPPNFEWTLFEDVICLSDSSGTFDDSHPVTYIWRIRGSEKYFNQNTKTIHVDGKFSQVPSKFKQIYLIGTSDSQSGKTIPLLFALSTSATKETYKEIFNNALKLGLQPENVFCDFETGAIGAAEEIWPDAFINCCFRHWKCSIKKRLKQRSVAMRDNKFQRLLKTVYSLAFAPLSKISSWFHLIRLRTWGIHLKIGDFFEYLRKTYIEPSATYRPRLWSCKERILFRQELTNNPSERLFSVYSRLFKHNNYQQLNIAIRRSLDWSKSVYKQERNGWAKSTKSKKVPLYKDPIFENVVNADYSSFDDFEKAMFGFMKIPKLGH